MGLLKRKGTWVVQGALNHENHLKNFICAGKKMWTALGWFIKIKLGKILFKIFETDEWIF